MATETETVWSSSSSASSTPVTVTVWAAFQFPVKNVKLAGETIISAVFALVKSKTTFPVGSVSRTTVKVSLVPLSLTLVEPPVSANVNPAESSAVVVT